jgi:hypothetical protein
VGKVDKNPILSIHFRNDSKQRTSQKCISNGFICFLTDGQTDWKGLHSEINLNAFPYGRRLQDEGLHNLYASPNINRVIKRRRMRWTGHVARMEAIRNAYKVLGGNLKSRDHLEDISIDGKVVIEFIIRK